MSAGIILISRIFWVTCLCHREPLPYVLFHRFFSWIIPSLFLISAEIGEDIHGSNTKFLQRALSVIEYSEFLIFLRHRKRFSSYTLGFLTGGHFMLIISPMFIIICSLDRISKSSSLVPWDWTGVPSIYIFLNHFTPSSKKKTRRTLNNLFGNVLH